MLFPVHGWRHPKRSTKKKIWVKSHTSYSYGVSIPTSPIMPLQNDRFPSKHLQDGLALWFSFFPQRCNLRFYTVQNCLGSWHPSRGSFQKHSHREQHDNLLICFLMVLSLETEKIQQTLLWFYSLQSWFLVHFGFTTKWVSWNWSHKSVLDSLDCSGPIRAHFLSANWVLDNG